ncbi:MAG: hypothetical protein KAH18_10700 [Psychromonas sp.]|nr:hypothetical protein [Psychromonas sp.]
MSSEANYKLVWEDKMQGGERYKLLRRKERLYTSTSKAKLAERGYIKDRLGIVERPDIVN